MKNALCFYGYFSINKIDYQNKSNEIHYTEIPKTFTKIVSINHFKKYIIKHNNIDIFFHCWNVDKDSQDLLINEYKPKKYLFEKQKNVHNLSDDPINSRLYSEEMSTKLMLEYQKENNIQYNLVMHTIFDNLFFVNINFENLNNEYIYNSNWNDTRPFKKNNSFYINNYGLYEQWYIANPNNIKIITNSKDYINIYKKYKNNNPLNNKNGSHFYRLILMKEENLVDKLKFILYVGQDHVKLNQIQVPWYTHLIKKCLVD